MALASSAGMTETNTENPDSNRSADRGTDSIANSVRVGVYGASGTGGIELLHLLKGHPRTEVVFATSRGNAGEPARSVDPGAPEIRFDHPDEVDPAGVDVAFLCVPHGTAGELAARCLEAGSRVIDLSGDHRLESRAQHESIYASPRDEEVAARAVYGFTEHARDRVRDSRMVANPGCYATTAIAALEPIARSGLLGGLPVIDAKSGVSGAGRAATATTHFGSVADDIRPYKPGRSHRHVAEIEQILSKSRGTPTPVVFTPHLVPLFRGIEATIFVPLSEGGAEDVRRVWSEAYGDDPFVRVLESGETARILGVARTNRIDLAVSPIDGVNAVIVTAALDNLVKGAGGQAIQNMNVMLGFDETTGLVGATS